MDVHAKKKSLNMTWWIRYHGTHITLSYPVHKNCIILQHPFQYNHFVGVCIFKIILTLCQSYETVDRHKHMCTYKYGLIRQTVIQLILNLSLFWNGHVYRIMHLQLIRWKFHLNKSSDVCRNNVIISDCLAMFNDTFVAFLLIVLFFSKMRRNGNEKLFWC